MKDNYKPWEVDYKEFYNLTGDEDRFKFLLRFAILAPSSHNSQPWKFRIDDNQITVFSENSRALPKSDKDGRQLFISLGTAIENILTSADFYGYKTDIRYFPTDIPDAVVSISLTRVRNELNSDEKLIRSIINRHTNRNKYSDKKLSDGFLGWIRSLSSDKFKIHIVDDKKQKDAVSDIVADAMIEAMDDKDFRSELSKYVRSNITKEKVGMPMFGFGVPTIPSLVVPYVLGKFNLNRLSKKDDSALLKDHTPYFVIINSIEDNQESWIKSGRIFQSIALMAEREGIKTAPMAAAIQIGDNYKKLKATIQTDFRPQVFFRMGYAEINTPHSPRLDVGEVLEKK